jgi:2-oxoisovalerate dehydrogenase E1 component
VTVALDEYFRSTVASWSSGVEPGGEPGVESRVEPGGEPGVEPGGEAGESDPRLPQLFEAQALSRHLDFAARELYAQGEGFYTIGSAGHESNAAVALALRPDDPALLHYRSGGFYCARASQVDGIDPVRDVVHGLTGSRKEPISHGRHKVFGHPRLHVIPQTSTIASHLPRAVGLAFGIHRAQRIGVTTPWPDDAVVVASLGDASINHSTAVGAFNAAGHAVHQKLPLPLLVVCEDNGWGISVPSPPGWVEEALSTRPGFEYVAADGADAPAALRAATEAAEWVRSSRSPVFLHLRTVRFLGHAGSDAELGYRRERDVQADYARDPLLGAARALVDAGWSPGAVLARYDAARQRVAGAVRDAVPADRLGSAEEVMRPLERRTRATSIAAAADRKDSFPRGLPEENGPLTLAQSVNAALTDVLAACPEAIVLGEDVGTKGGVYGVTLGLQKTFGSTRVFDTPLDEQTILGLALGTSLAGLLPIAEIQYLAYLHNAEDQLRGEAATIQFFSDGQYSNGMVVRIASLASLKGFGGHFHNDNAIGVLRDIPGIVVACPSSAAEAPELLRTLAGMAAGEGRVGVLLEPTAMYHDKDHSAPYPPPERWRPGKSDRETGRLHWGGREVLVVTFGNGVSMAKRAAERAGVAATVFDLRWLVPLPVLHLLSVVAAFPKILVVDETRRSGGVSEGVVTALVEGGYTGAIRRVTAEDSFVPLGPAAAHVVLTEDDVVAALSSFA